MYFSEEEIDFTHLCWVGSLSIAPSVVPKYDPGSVVVYYHSGNVFFEHFAIGGFPFSFV